MVILTTMTKHTAERWSFAMLRPYSHSNSLTVCLSYFSAALPGCFHHRTSEPQVPEVFCAASIWPPNLKIILLR
jgi:hypothetical protein